MSTRCTTHFVSSDTPDKPDAIIYRHSDGYPEGAGIDLQRFLEDCSKLADSRFNDPSYLAAKYVVFLADMFNYQFEPRKNGVGVRKVRPKSRLEFISVGVVSQDPWDIEYRYVVTSNGGDMPTVKCFAVDFDWKTGKQTKCEPVEIPPQEQPK